MADLSDVAARELPPKSHNNPPSDVEILSEQLTIRNVHVISAARSHIEMSGKIPDHFTEENEASFTADFVKLMHNCSKELERRRKEEGEPFLRSTQQINAFFGEFTAALTQAIAKANLPLSDWLRRKAQAEQDERDAIAKALREQQQAALANAAANNAPDVIEKAIEASIQVKVADSLAAAPINSMASSAGKSSRAGLVTKWVGTITDVDQLDLIKLRPFIPAKELQAALDRYVKQGGRQCEGTKIVEVTEAKVK